MIIVNASSLASVFRNNAGGISLEFSIPAQNISRVGLHHLLTAEQSGSEPVFGEFNVYEVIPFGSYIWYEFRKVQGDPDYYDSTQFAEVGDINEQDKIAVVSEEAIYFCRIE